MKERGSWDICQKQTHVFSNCHWKNGKDSLCECWRYWILLKADVKWGAIYQHFRGCIDCIMGFEDFQHKTTLRMAADYIYLLR